MSYSEEPSLPGAWLLAMGVIFPILVVVIELVTGLCAGVFFDPLPTWGHIALVLAVPAINFILWRALRRDRLQSRWLLVGAGAAIAISGAYCLMFLPLLPIALIAILYFGFGLLPFAPMFAIIATVKMAGPLAGEQERAGRRIFAGVGIGLAALLLIDLPATATYVAIRWAGGDEASARRAPALMRIAGDEQMLLRLCYGDDGRATGLLSFLASSWGDGIFAQRGSIGNQAARELYFRSTGRAFNAVPPPGRGPGRGEGWDFRFNRDQGGEAVGQREEGVRLDQSRLDGSVALADNLAYLEWTATFANRSDIQREARLSLALPAGAVASRATLWVNGEPREASVAGRGEARAAYANVVQMRRDPLLVTTDGAGRLLVQAFPIQPGQSLKLRIGITAPLDIAPDGSRSLALPAIADAGFDIPSELRHAVWIEGDGPIAWAPAKLADPALASGTRLRNAFADSDLAERRPRIWAAAITAPSTRTAILPAKDHAAALRIVQTIAPAPAAPVRSLAILIDGSAGNREAASGFRRALGSIPAGLPVSLYIAAQSPKRVGLAPWSASQRVRFEQALDETEFTGGQDNVPLLAEAMEKAAGPGATLVWIHGPQPVAFAHSTSRLEQVLERSASLPRLVRYQAAPGARYSISGNAWFEEARDVVPTGDAAADLSALAARLGRDEWRISRAEAPAAAGAGPAWSVHLARLWGAEKLASAAASRGADREKAIALAHRLNIVTPVSGAVVLETDQDYKANGLPVPDPAEVPTVPEPGTWALIVVAMFLFLWTMRRRLPLWIERRRGRLAFA